MNLASSPPLLQCTGHFNESTTGCSDTLLKQVFPSCVFVCCLSDAFCSKVLSVMKSWITPSGRSNGCGSRIVCGKTSSTGSFSPLLKWNFYAINIDKCCSNYDWGPTSPVILGNPQLRESAVLVLGTNQACGSSFDLAFTNNFQDYLSR